MNDYIHRLITLNIEIEGLLRTCLERSDDAVRALLFDKFREYSELMKILEQETEDSEPENKVIIPEPAPHVELEHEPEAEPEPEPEPEPEADLEPEYLPEPVMEPERVPFDEDDDSTAADDDIRVDEMISRKEARDLARAFTLNDKFRFARELFCDNKEAFTAAVDYIARLHTLAEAETYLYRDLALDPESDTVCDFMAIIANHFNGR